MGTIIKFPEKRSYMVALIGPKKIRITGRCPVKIINDFKDLGYTVFLS